MDPFEIVKTIVQLSIGVGSLLLSIAILRWTRRARARFASDVVDLIRNEIKDITDGQQVIMTALQNLNSKVEKLGGGKK